MDTAALTKEEEQRKRASEQQRRRRAENHERVLEIEHRSKTKRHKENPELVRSARERYRRWAQQHWDKKLLATYRCSAARRGFGWQLTDEQALMMLHDKCYWHGKSRETRGIDRTDNTKGYLVHNCVPCCTWCNTGKSDMTVDEWDKFIEDLATEQLARADVHL
jgi:hypothetical protein